MFEFFFALIMLMYYVGSITNSSIASSYNRRLVNAYDRRKKKWISIVTDSNLEAEVSRMVFNPFELHKVNDILRNIIKDIEGFPDINPGLTMDAKKIKHKYGLSKKESEECERLERDFAIRTIMAHNGKLTSYEAISGIRTPWAWYMFSSIGRSRHLCINYFEWINNRINEVNNIDEKMVVRTCNYKNYYYFDAVKDSKMWTYNVLWEPQVVDPKRIMYHL